MAEKPNELEIETEIVRMEWQLRLKQIREIHEWVRGSSWHGEYPFEDIEFLLSLIDARV